MKNQQTKESKNTEIAVIQNCTDFTCRMLVTGGYLNVSLIRESNSKKMKTMN